MGVEIVTKLGASSAFAVLALVIGGCGGGGTDAVTTAPGARPPVSSEAEVDGAGVDEEVLEMHGYPYVLSTGFSDIVTFTGNDVIARGVVRSISDPQWSTDGGIVPSEIESGLPWSAPHHISSHATLSIAEVLRLRPGFELAPADELRLNLIGGRAGRYEAIWHAHPRNGDLEVGDEVIAFLSVDRSEPVAGNVHGVNHLFLVTGNDATLIAEPRDQYTVSVDEIRDTLKALEAVDVEALRDQYLADHGLD